MVDKLLSKVSYILFFISIIIILCDTDLNVFVQVLIVLIFALNTEIIVSLLKKLFKYIKANYFGCEYIAKKYLLNYISDDEVNFLVDYFYKNNENRFSLCSQIDLTNGIKAGLVGKCIIYRSSNYSSYGTIFNYNLQPYAIKFLNKNIAKQRIVVDKEQIKFFKRLIIRTHCSDSIMSI